MSQQLIIALGGEPASQEAVEMVARASAPTELALQALSVVVMAPVQKNAFFRGVIYPLRFGPPPPGDCRQLTLFAAIHGSLALMLPLTVLAVILVWLYEKTGSIVAPILMHAAFNAVNFAMIKPSPNRPMSLHEAEFIQRLTQDLPADSSVLTGPGDDCAVLDGAVPSCFSKPTPSSKASISTGHTPKAIGPAKP